MSSPKRKPTISPGPDVARHVAVQRDVTRSSEARSPPDAPSDAELLAEITVHDFEPGGFAIASWSHVLMVRWESAADGSAVERLASASPRHPCTLHATRR